MAGKMIYRRSFIGLVAALAARPLRGAAPDIRAITRGPKFHWFGYYDKLQVDPSGRYALGMQVDFEHRSPRGDDVIRVGMVDLEGDDRWIDLGETRAWNWQQGCMLQWLPGSGTDVIWNDRQEGRFVSHIVNVRTGKRRTLPAPVYCLSPDGKEAVYPDFRRLNDTRPGYGYASLPDPNENEPAPEDAGIWRMDLRTGKTSLIIPFRQAASIAYEKGGLENAKHWFNHLLYSPDGKRFIFLHRWRPKERSTGNWETRMFTAGRDGKDLYVLDPHGKTSHFIWRDPSHVLAWAWHPSHNDAFYLYRDGTAHVEAVGLGVMKVNGHCSYLPGNQWILNDAYPDKDRKQQLYLYNVTSGERRELGRFQSPPEYTGEWRCDLHPRFTPDGRKVLIDSTHGGNGRQMYLIDISAVTG
jgi:hypothetical protein